jgi:hypothetical protein
LHSAWCALRLGQDLGGAPVDELGRYPPAEIRGFRRGAPALSLYGTRAIERNDGGDQLEFVVAGA